MLLTKRWVPPAPAVKTAAPAAPTAASASSPKKDLAAADATEAAPAKGKATKKGSKHKSVPATNDAGDAGERPKKRVGGDQADRPAKGPKKRRRHAAAASDAVAGPADEPAPAERTQEKLDDELLAEATEYALTKPQHEPGKPGSRKKRRLKHFRNLVHKDVSEAAEYLHSWSMSRKDPTSATWKFNKATQAWLLRHAYETDKVEKDTFKVLLRYLDGLKGTARERLRSEADAVMLQEGAQVRPPPDELQRKTKKQAKTVANDEAVAEAAVPDAADGDTGEAAIDQAPKVDEAERKMRKIRLKRAQAILKATKGLGDSAAS